MTQDEESIQLLRNDFTHFIEFNNLQHHHILEKLEAIHTEIIKDLILYNNRIDKLEKEVESLKTHRIYVIAAAALITLIIPYLIQIGLALLS